MARFVFGNDDPILDYDADLELQQTFDLVVYKDRLATIKLTEINYNDREILLSFISDGDDRLLTKLFSKYSYVHCDGRVGIIEGYGNEENGHFQIDIALYCDDDFSDYILDDCQDNGYIKDNQLAISISLESEREYSISDEDLEYLKNNDIGAYVDARRHYLNLFVKDMDEDDADYVEDLYHETYINILVAVDIVERKIYANTYDDYDVYYDKTEQCNKYQITRKSLKILFSLLDYYDLLLTDISKNVSTLTSIVEQSFSMIPKIGLDRWKKLIRSAELQKCSEEVMVKITGSLFLTLERKFRIAEYEDTIIEKNICLAICKYPNSNYRVISAILDSLLKYNKITDAKHIWSFITSYNITSSISNTVRGDLISQLLVKLNLKSRRYGRYESDQPRLTSEAITLLETWINSVEDVNTQIALRVELYRLI